MVILIGSSKVISKVVTSLDELLHKDSTATNLEFPVTHDCGDSPVPAVSKTVVFCRKNIVLLPTSCLYMKINSTIEQDQDVKKV